MLPQEAPCLLVKCVPPFVECVCGCAALAPCGTAASGVKHLSVVQAVLLHCTLLQVTDILMVANVLMFGLQQLTNNMVTVWGIKASGASCCCAGSTLPAAACKSWPCRCQRGCHWCCRLPRGVRLLTPMCTRRVANLPLRHCPFSRCRPMPSSRWGSGGGCSPPPSCTAGSATCWSTCTP